MKATQKGLEPEVRAVSNPRAQPSPIPHPQETPGSLWFASFLS